MAKNRDPKQERPEFSPEPIIQESEGPKWKGPTNKAGVKEGKGDPSFEMGLQLFRQRSHHGSTQEGKNDGAWAAYFRAEAKGEALKVEYDPEDWTGAAYLLDAEVDVQGIYSTADILESLGLKAPQGLQEPTRFVVSQAWAARSGDMTLHGEPLSELMGSHNVRIGGTPAWRVMVDFQPCSQQTAGVPHGGGFVLQGAPTVRINGLPAVRAGDAIMETAGGPNPISGGEPTVLLGEPGPPVDCLVPVPAPPPTGLAKWLDVDINAMIGRAKMGAQLGGERTEDGAKAGLFGGAKASLFSSEAEGSWKIPLSDDWAISLGVKGEGSLLSAGANAGGGVSWGAKGPDGKRRWGLDKWGAGAGAGLFGGGLEISIGLESK